MRSAKWPKVSKNLVPMFCDTLLKFFFASIDIRVDLCTGQGFLLEDLQYASPKIGWLGKDINKCLRETDGKPTCPIHTAPFVLRTMQSIHFDVNTRISTRGHSDKNQPAPPGWCSQVQVRWHCWDCFYCQIQTHNYYCECCLRRWRYRKQNHTGIISVVSRHSAYIMKKKHILPHGQLVELN
jgi:hypothetical protein